jgi:hypothetical protein
MSNVLRFIEAIGNVLRNTGDQELARRIIGALRSLQDRHEVSSRYLGAAGQPENAA